MPALISLSDGRCLYLTFLDYEKLTVSFWAIEHGDDLPEKKN